jgi:flagellar motor switch/type III secretory pathway protein FliN
MTLAKVLRQAVARCADDCFDMAMAALSLRREALPGADLAPLAEAAALLLILEGPAGRRGAALLDRPLVAALIQQQTMGRLLPQAPEAEGAARPMTATDAALCAPFIDGLFARCQGRPEAPEEALLVAGLRFGARAETARQLLMALTAPDYEVCHLALDLAGGLAQGRLTLCLPQAGAEEEGPEVAAGAAPEGVRPRSTLAPAVMGLRAELNCAIAQLRLPLKRLSALRPGELLELPAARFEAVTLLAPDGTAVGRGALGQVAGERAVQLAGQAGAEGVSPGAHPVARAGGGAAGAVVPEVEVPEMEGLAEMAALPEMPELDGLPEMPELDGLPEMPELDRLPEMPELEGLPELEPEGDPEKAAAPRAAAG